MPKFKIGDVLIDKNKIIITILDVDDHQYIIRNSWGNLMPLDIWKMDNISNWELSLSSTLKHL